ncbi:hypothetical protein ACWDYH_38325 [Nocardia goodfellowii]
MSAWAPLFTVLGTVIAGTAALCGVVYTSHTADRREYEKWRRDSILSTVAVVLTESNAVRSKVSSDDLWTVDEHVRLSEEVFQSIAAIDPHRHTLRLLSDEVAEKCDHLLGALDNFAGWTIDQKAGEFGGQMTAEEVREAIVGVASSKSMVDRQTDELIETARAEVGRPGRTSTGRRFASRVLNRREGRQLPAAAEATALSPTSANSLAS